MIMRSPMLRESDYTCKSADADTGTNINSTVNAAARAKWYNREDYEYIRQQLEECLADRKKVNNPVQEKRCAEAYKKFMDHEFCNPIPGIIRRFVDLPLCHTKRK